MFTVGWDVTVYVLYQNSSVYVYSRVGCYIYLLYYIKTAVCMFIVGWDVTVYVQYYIRTAVCTFTVGWDVICTISEQQCVRL